MQWLEADKHCQNMESHLVEVTSQEQMEYLTLAMSTRDSDTGYWSVLCDDFG